MSKRRQRSKVALVVVMLAAAFPTHLICGDRGAALDLSVEANQPQHSLNTETKDTHPISAAGIYQRFAEREAQRQEEVMSRAYLDVRRKWVEGYHRRWRPRYLYPSYFPPRHIPGDPRYIGYRHRYRPPPYRW